MVTRCHSLPFVVIRCITRCHSLSLVVIRCHSLYHSLSFVITPCTTRLSFYKQSLIFDQPKYIRQKSSIFHRDHKCFAKIILITRILSSTLIRVSGQLPPEQLPPRNFAPQIIVPQMIALDYCFQTITPKINAPRQYPPGSCPGEKLPFG